MEVGDEGEIVLVEFEASVDQTWGTSTAGLEGALSFSIQSEEGHQNPSALVLPPALETWAVEAVAVELEPLGYAGVMRADHHHALEKIVC